MNGDAANHLHEIANQIQILDLRLRLLARQTEIANVQELVIKMRETLNIIIDETRWLSVLINASTAKPPTSELDE